jgi:hypothetical protein
MAEPFLTNPPRHASFQQMGRIGVPQGMDGGIFRDATLAHHGREGLVAGSGGQGHRAVPGREHPGAGPRAPPVIPHQRQPPGCQWSEAVCPPLALVHPHQHALGVNVGDVQRRPLCQAQPAGIDQRQTRPGRRIVDQGQQGSDLPHTQHDGQFWDAPRSHEVEDWPWALQGVRVDEPDPLEVKTEGPLRHLLVVAQEEEVLPEVRFTHLIRSPSVVLGEVFDGVEIALLGLGGQAPELPIFQHPASERSHRHPPVRGESHGSKRSTRIRKIDGRSACGKSDREKVGGTSGGETSFLPRSGFVQLLSRWKCFHITLPTALREMWI